MSSGSLESVHSMTTFSGQVITGAVVSCTVTIWLILLEFPQESVAVQVCVMAKFPTHESTPPVHLPSIPDSKRAWISAALAAWL